MNQKKQPESDQIILPTISNPPSPQDIRNAYDLINKEFPLIQAEFKDLKEITDELMDRNSAEEFWDWIRNGCSGPLEEKKDEMLFLLSKSSSVQLESIRVLLYLSCLIGQMANKLKDQQDVIIKQQEDLKTADQKLGKAQDDLGTVQKELKAQQDTIQKNTETILEQNEQLIENSNELKALRKIGADHDDAITRTEQCLLDIQKNVRSAVAKNDSLETDIRNLRDNDIKNLSDGINATDEQLKAEIKNLRDNDIKNLSDGINATSEQLKAEIKNLRDNDIKNLSEGINATDEQLKAEIKKLRDNEIKNLSEGINATDEQLKAEIKNLSDGMNETTELCKRQQEQISVLQSRYNLSGFLIPVTVLMLLMNIGLLVYLFMKM